MLKKNIMVETTKDIALKKKKKLKMIFLIMIIVVAALLITWGIVKLVKKRKQDKILNGETNTTNNPPIGGEGSPGSGGSGINTPGNIKAVQAAINKKYPEAKLEEDGVLGPLTKAAIIKYFGASSFPLTQDSLTKIVSGVDPIKIGYPKPNTASNDSFPLVKGSKGTLVKSLKEAVGTIQKKYPVNTSTDVFDEQLYTAINAGLGTKYYPVTVENYKAIGDMFNTYLDPLYNPKT